MTEKAEVKIVVAMNEDGDYVLASSEDVAIEKFDEDIGGYARRVICFTVHMTPPAVEETDEIDVPDTAGTTEQIEVEAA